jgi:hypothetical protein
LADVQHDVARVGSPPRLSPQLELRDEVSLRLSGERWVGWPDPLTLLAVAGGAGREPTRRIAAMVQGRGQLAPARRARRPGGCHRGVVVGHCAPLAAGEFLGDVTHLRMTAPAVSIGDQLPFEISRIDPGEPRREGAVAFAGKAVAGDAGVLRAGARAAQRDELPGSGKPFGRFHRCRTAARRRERARYWTGEERSRHLPREPAPFAVGSGGVALRGNVRGNDCDVKA